ncbi:unnamed protein product [Arctogadus glacialis]
MCSLPERDRAAGEAASKPSVSLKYRCTASQHELTGSTQPSAELPMNTLLFSADGRGAALMNTDWLSVGKLHRPTLQPSDGFGGTELPGLLAMRQAERGGACALMGGIMRDCRGTVSDMDTVLYVNPRSMRSMEMRI